MEKSSGFVHVVNVVDTYLPGTVLKTRVLLMLLMLLIFFGSTRGMVYVLYIVPEKINNINKTRILSTF